MLYLFGTIIVLSLLLDPIVQRYNDIIGIIIAIIIIWILIAIVAFLIPKLLIAGIFALG